MEEDQANCNLNNGLLFRLAILNSFKHIAESVSEDEFRQILTVLVTKKASVVQKLHKAMVKELYESMSGDLEDVLKDGSMYDALAKVAKLSENADVPAHEKLWRPPGDVRLHLRSLDAQKMKEESEKLEKQVNELENENAILMKKITESRSRVYAVCDTITRSVSRSTMALEYLGKRWEQLEQCFELLEEV